jgi:hypothetical protein
LLLPFIDNYDEEQLKKLSKNVMTMLYNNNNHQKLSSLLKDINNTSPGNSYDSSLANRIIQPAADQLNKNISYSTNPGAISEYFKATNFPTGASTRQPWCAAFVSWNIKQSSLFDEETRPKTASAFGFVEWAKQDKVKNRVALYNNPREVKPGDIIVFSWSHAGIATSASIGDTFKTIEGNTGQGVVAERTRKLSGVKYSLRVVS